MLYGLPPYSGISESTMVTSAPRPTSRSARCEPLRPWPPVTTRRAPASRETSGGTVARLRPRAKQPAVEVVEGNRRRMVRAPEERLERGPVAQPARVADVPVLQPAAD